MIILNDLQQKINSISQKLDLPSLILQKTELEAQTQKTGFWEELDKAQQISQKLSSFTKTISDIQEITSQLKISKK